MLKKNGPLEEGKWFYYLRQKKKQNKLTLFTSTDLRAKCKEQWSMAFGLRYRYCRLLRWNQIGLIACTFRRFSIWNMGATNRSFLAACLKLLSEKKKTSISVKCSIKMQCICQNLRHFNGIWRKLGHLISCIIESQTTVENWKKYRGNFD